MVMHSSISGTIKCNIDMEVVMVDLQVDIQEEVILEVQEEEHHGAGRSALGLLVVEQEIVHQQSITRK
jgi:hypothetical protein